MLYLYPNSSDAERKIREKQSEIRTILGLSEGCGARWDQYLVEALTFDFDQEKLPNPDQHKEKWSEVNGAEIVKAYWKSGRLILSMASQEDALAICRMDTVSLEVSSLVVPPRGAGTQTKIGSDHLSLPTLSFVISALMDTLNVELASFPRHTRGQAWLDACRYMSHHGPHMPSRPVKRCRHPNKNWMMRRQWCLS